MNNFKDGSHLQVEKGKVLNCINKTEKIQANSKKILKQLIMDMRVELPFSLSPKDVVKLLPHGQTKVYQMLESGEIPAKKLGGKWVISRDVFLSWYFGNEFGITED